MTPTACGCPDGGSHAPVGPDASPCLCGACGQDSDCTAGTNGRCGEEGPAAYLICSYDQCFADSDCEGGVPCTCRGTAARPNLCQTGSNCTVDADCGPGGYCSPSLVNNACFCDSTQPCSDAGGCSRVNGISVPCECGDTCAHGYFCHTRCDACVDDSDCGGPATCNYDAVDQRWECNYCLGIP